MKIFPSSPFSTPLSGSARETERRLQNICQGPKKRPPILSLALASVLALSCGSLVSCQSQETLTLSDLFALSGEPYQIEQTLPTSCWLLDEQELTQDALSLEGLTTETLPTTLADLSDLEHSPSWNQLVWLLAQDEERDTALYGVAQIGPYNDWFKTYGVIVRVDSRWAFYPLEWWCSWQTQRVPELWFGDYDEDGQEELAFALAWAQAWTQTYQGRQESLFFVELDTLEYTPLDPAGPFGLSTAYNQEAQVLSISTGHQLLQIDDVSELRERPEPLIVEFTRTDGQIRCQVQFLFSNPSEEELVVPMELTLKRRNGDYAMGNASFTASVFSAEAQNPQLFWLDDRGQVLQASTREEYEAGGQPYLDPPEALPSLRDL